ncbi:MAG: bifunctional metallophosphatase/5'-nucleotidase [Spirochaetales bacterium]|nr:bifunctional metallophosphatase/5'-nucleotidase [Spirochaetales bacterium]
MKRLACIQHPGTVKAVISGILSVILVFLTSGIFAQKKTLTIIHTNDLHSHLLGFGPNIDYTPFSVNDDETVGGWARIAAVIDEIRSSRGNPVLVLDAGDFTMGTLFHMRVREDATELGLLHAMGYDAVCLGNHEFDLMPSGLAAMLSSARERGGMPRLVCANVIFSPESGKDDALEAMFREEAVTPYIICERAGIRIGIFGVLGKDAAEDSPFASPLTFTGIVETSRDMVRVLREEEKADMVICLSHSGLHENPSHSEDEILASKVDGIDVIVSGHTHTRLLTPIPVNDTIIVQAWAYGRHVGVLDVEFENGKVKTAGYRIQMIDDTISGKSEIDEAIKTAKDSVNDKVLAGLDLTFDDVIAETAFDLASVEDESNLGNMIADSIRWYVDNHDYDPGDPATKVALAIESNGLIRDDLCAGKSGKVAVCDLFRTFPLGIGMDDTMCYPIVTMYLYASEIKKALEILTSVYPLKGSNYFIQISGVKFTYNPHRMIFDRVTDIWLGDLENGYVPLDYSGSNKTLYRVAGNIYNSTFLKVIGRFTMNILDIVPKKRDGSPVSDLSDMRVDMDRNTPGIQELKEWIGLLRYVQSFDDTDADGLPDIPEKYRGKEGRIVSDPGWNPVSLLSRGTWITWSAFSIVVALVSAIGLTVFIVIRRIKRKKKG